MIKQGGKRGRTGTFDNAFLDLDHHLDGTFDRAFFDQNDVIELFLTDFKRQAAGLFDSDAFGNGDATAGEFLAVYAFIHGRVKLGFNPDHFDVGPARFDCGDNARCQTATANRHDNRVDVFVFIKDFEPDSALACDDMRIIKRMDEGQTAFLLDAARGLKAFGKHVAGQNDFGAVRARMMNLGVGGVFRHHDGGGNTKSFGVIGDTLRVVASRYGDNTFFAFFRSQACQFDIGATFLERRGILLIFKFQINIRLANV